MMQLAHFFVCMAALRVWICQTRYSAQSKILVDQQFWTAETEKASVLFFCNSKLVFAPHVIAEMNVVHGSQCM